VQEYGGVGVVFGWLEAASLGLSLVLGLAVFAFWACILLLLLCPSSLGELTQCVTSKTMIVPFCQMPGLLHVFTAVLVQSEGILLTGYGTHL
jgi:hypothetical protein